MSEQDHMVVFLGPTISDKEACEHIAARCLGPVKRGDIFNATNAGVKTIGIVDGLFENVAPVWHKEILWAMYNGVSVYGSASMGALRAAELCDFGMIGVGRIFDAYRSGMLMDDDEVAVRHGPAEIGFPALSEAMVNIRETVDSALALQLIDSDAATRIIDVAKSYHYSDRTWDKLILSKEVRLSEIVIERLRAWLPSGKIDLKRADALQMLKKMAIEKDAEPARVIFEFQHTSMWQMFLNSVS